VVAQGVQIGKEHRRMQGPALAECTGDLMTVTNRVRATWAWAGRIWVPSSSSFRPPS